MTIRTLQRGLIAAGLMNIAGVLVFSRAFTNRSIPEADPVVMSNFGLVMIVVWGFAYLAAVLAGGGIRWLLAVFAIEKLIYFLMWLAWHSKNRIADLYGQDLFAGIFFSIYGLNDFAFMVFFAGAFFRKERSINQ